MTLEHEMKQMLWEAASATEAVILARLAEGEEVPVNLMEVLAAKLGAVEAAVIRIARELDKMRPVGPVEHNE